MKTLLLPLDGSALAEQALSRGLGQYAGEKVSILLLTCLDFNLTLLNATELSSDTIDELMERDRRVAQRYLDQQVDRLAELGLSARTVLYEGSPVEGILATAREHEVDQIVLVTHGRGGLARLFLGSVAEGVIRKADRPVMIIPSNEQSHHAVPALAQA